MGFDIEAAHARIARLNGAEQAAPPCTGGGSSRKSGRGRAPSRGWWGPGRVPPLPSPRSLEERAGDVGCRAPSSTRVRTSSTRLSLRTSPACTRR